MRYTFGKEESFGRYESQSSRQMAYMYLDSPLQRDLVALINVSRSFEKETTRSCEIHSAKVLGEDVGTLLFGSNVLELDSVELDHGTHVVLLKFHVLVASGDHFVGSHVNACLVVLIDRSRHNLRHLQLIERVA